MESKYTLKELSLLVDTLNPSTDYFKNNLGQCITNGIPEVIHYMIKDMYDMYYNFMYIVPYEELPLHINNKNDIVADIVKWRFTLGK